MRSEAWKGWDNRIGRRALAALAAGVFLFPAGRAAAIEYQVELAQSAAADPLRLDVAVGCENGSAQFRITNAGTPWPQAGTFNIYRETDGKRLLVAKRRMRLGDAQHASFRVKKAAGTTLTLFVEPSWYDRPFTADARVSCE